MPATLLTVDNLYKHLPDDFELKPISFSLNEAGKLAIIGASGAGKTTLLKIIAGLMQPTSGKAFINNERILGPDEQLLPGHKSIAYLSQQYELRNNYFVKDLIWFENKLSLEAANTFFEVCNIQHLLHRKTNQLSGGEKQRIALCMLLIKKPQLLILDEPFSNLDLIHKNSLKTVVANISSQLKNAIILASHEPADVLGWAKEVLVLQNGKLIQQAPPQQIYHKPTNEYVAALTGIYNVLPLPLIEKCFANCGVDSSKKYLVRPQDIFITNIESAPLIGKINSIVFFGNFYQINVLTGEVLLQIQVLKKNTFEIGDSIGLEINLNALIMVDE